MIKIEDGTVQAEGTPFQLSIELAIIIDNMKKECGDMCVALALLMSKTDEIKDLTIEDEPNDQN